MLLISFIKVCECCRRWSRHFGYLARNERARWSLRPTKIIGLPTTGVHRYSDRRMSFLWRIKERNVYSLQGYSKRPLAALKNKKGLSPVQSGQNDHCELSPAVSEIRMLIRLPDSSELISDDDRLPLAYVKGLISKTDLLGEHCMLQFLPARHSPFVNREHIAKSE